MPNIDGLPPGTNDQAAELVGWQTTATPYSYKFPIVAARVAFLTAVPKAVQTAGSATLLDTDHYVPCDSTAGPVMLAPPAAPLDGQELIIVDVTGAASPTNYIAFGAPVSAHSAPQIVVPYGFWRLRYDANQGKWYQC